MKPAGPETRPVPPCFSGIYPHLAYFSDAGECGTGAVVPWADRLWVITYPPHSPGGSSNKLYEIDASLNRIVRPESVGGTCANRLIHRESSQLFIGRYAIDSQRNVRVLSPNAVKGRLTATARHLDDPAGKVYFATMEEGFYEVDVKSLGVKGLYPDANGSKSIAGSLLPGYHGKGAYSGQGRLVYANNGELSGEAQKRPDIASGCLAEWNGRDWTVIRRNQFTEVTGPGGINGNTHDTDPIWSIGWDHRSLILMLLDGGKWSAFRLPKASHCYDGAHGWNTEWPRIRDIGEADLLMTMHGMFWRFPRGFSAANTAGIRPRSTYLKVIGDFCRWNDRLVFGCDDAAKSEFLNKRPAKGGIAGPGISQSNLWFVEPGELDRLGPAIGRGAVWLNDAVAAGAWSDPFLVAGFERRGIHLRHQSGEPITFQFEIDSGRGQWTRLRDVTVPARGYTWFELPVDLAGEWLRVRTDRDCKSVTCQFAFSNADRRTTQADVMFDGLAPATSEKLTAALLRAGDKQTLQVAASILSGSQLTDIGYYELDGEMKLRRVENDAAMQSLKKSVAIPRGVLSVDDASVIYRDEAGRRWRLPRGDASFDAVTGQGLARIDREVVTERDLFNCHGTFYELPAENAGGFAKIRPIATHNRRITDYCSYRGMLILSGIAAGESANANAHIIRSDDGKAAVWAGVVDDLWKLGRPVGRGGPWKNSAARAAVPSDPYLMTGYDSKRIQLSHSAAEPVNFDLEVDITGSGDWCVYRTLTVQPGQTLEHEFPAAFQACWLRITADHDCTATAWLVYE